LACEVGGFKNETSKNLTPLVLPWHQYHLVARRWQRREGGADSGGDLGARREIGARPGSAETEGGSPGVQAKMGSGRGGGRGAN